jgi:LPXTG-site transpeptidase (sortase) family protein
MGWLEIPRLGISATVAHGDDVRTLMRAVGHIPGTALPGEAGNVGLAGHRDTFFRALRGIEKFDSIRLVMPDRVIAYRVVDIGIVRPSRIEVLDHTPVPSLTLVTCYPFDYVGSAPYRYVVRAQELRTSEGESASSEPRRRRRHSSGSSTPSHRHRAMPREPARYRDEPRESTAPPPRVQGSPSLGETSTKRRSPR